MATRTQTEEIQLRIVASGNAAKKELAELSQTKAKLQRQVDGLNKKSKDYVATKRKLQAEIKATDQRMRKLRGEIDLNTMSMRDLRNRARDLKRVMDNMNPASPEWRRLNGDLQKVNGRMKQLRGTASSMKSTWGGMMNMVKGGIAAYAGIEGVRMLWRGATNAVKDYIKQQQSVAKVQQAIRSTGKAAGLSLKELRKEATALQKRTLFGDETILNDASAQLLTFTNIAGENFLRTQRVALDLSTVLDGDLKSASIQLGKALNAPVQNLSALSRSGIQFSVEQRALIKSLAESGRLAEAQVVILDELEKQYGGQAEAAALASGGWQQVGNILGDTSEAFGGLISALFNTDAMSAGMIETLSSLNEKLDNFTQTVKDGRQWLREWYNDSVTVRTGVQALGAVAKTVMLIVAQAFDAVIVQPIKGVMAAVKAVRAATSGEFGKARDILKQYGSDAADDWAEFGADVKAAWVDAYKEIRNPEPWKDLTENSQGAFNKMQNAAEQALAKARADIAEMQRLLGAGEGGTGAERGGEVNTSFDKEKLQKEIEERAELANVMYEFSRTQEELDIEAANAYYDRLNAMAVKHKVDTTSIEKARQEELDRIRGFYRSKNSKAEEITMQQGLQALSGGLDQIEGLMGEHAAGLKAFGLFKLAIDTATSISSAIAGASSAAAATGPGAPFALVGYITTMVASVVTAFVKAKKLISGADAPKFATGGVLNGKSHAEGGMAVVDENGVKQAEVEGGEAILPVSTTMANMPLISTMLQNPGKTLMPSPAVSVDTGSLNASIGRSMPSYANGGIYSGGDDVPEHQNDNMAVVQEMLRALPNVLKAEVSLRRFTDKEDDLADIKNYSDIRATT